MNNKRLAVAIITKNNIRTIEETVVSVQGLCDHILVVDSGSTDGTIEFCKSQGVEVAHRDWPGVADQKQFCIDACADYQWVLSLDSDESLDETLFEGVKSIVAENDSQYDGYSFNRKVWFMNGWLDNVFQPEFRMRLFRGGIAKVEAIGPEGKGGHDRFEVPGKVGFIAGTCKHDSWIDAGDMMARYVELGKRAALYDPKPSSVGKLFLSPLVAFVKQYFIKGGFKDGRRGLIAAGGVACGNFIKQLLKLAK